MNDMQRMAAEVAVKQMLIKNRIDICDIRKILEMTGGIPPKEDMQVLELLHCVSFSDIPAELLRGLPLILQRVLGADSLQFEFKSEQRKLMLVV